MHVCSTSRQGREQDVCSTSRQGREQGVYQQIASSCIDSHVSDQLL